MYKLFICVFFLLTLTDSIGKWWCNFLMSNADRGKGQSEKWSWPRASIAFAVSIMLYCPQDYHENKHIECKILTVGLGQSAAVLKMGTVKDGVMCGDNRICMIQTCKDISDMRSFTRCPQNIATHGGHMEECSGNGVRALQWRKFFYEPHVSEMLQHQHMCLWSWLE